MLNNFTDFQLEDFRKLIQNNLPKYIQVVIDNVGDESFRVTFIFPDNSKVSDHIVDNIELSEEYAKQIIESIFEVYSIYLSII